MSDLVERLREARHPIRCLQAADEIERLTARNQLLEEVALHARRTLGDPSWGSHKVNLLVALSKLESEDDDE